MQTKLTLRLEDELINKAKIVASKRGKSLSKLVSEYFAHISRDEITDQNNLPPLVKSLYGCLANEKLDEADYKEHLEKKYL